MRLRLLMAVMAVIVAVGLLMPEPAHAIAGWYDRDWRRVPRHESRNRVVDHWLRPPHGRYRYRVHTAEDPYAYRYDRRGYYPYYGAGYWRPRYKQVGRYRDGIEKPPYYPAWGYGARRCWRAVRHDGHRRYHHVRVRCRR